MPMDKKKDGSGLVNALRLSERGAAKSGESPELSDVLECAEREISVKTFQHLWNEAQEFPIKGDKHYQAVFDRAQWRMSDAVGVDRTLHGHVVGHALVRASEGGFTQVVARLLSAIAELKCSVLAPRFLSFAMLTAVEGGNYEIVHEILRTTSLPTLALMRYELSKAKDGGYPFVRARLTSQWIKCISKTKWLLPPAIPAVDSERVDLKARSSEDESAIKSCYQSYCLWRFLVVAVCNGHGAVVQELLMKRDGCNSRRSLSTDEIQARDQIDETFALLAMKVAGKLGWDMILYSLHNAVEKTSALSHDGKLWRCTSRSQLGVWEVFMEVPVLLMELESSYQNSKELKELMRPYHYIKPVIPQLMKLNIQLKVLIDIQPNYIEMVVGINHVRVTVESQCWEEKRTGHFPTFISLGITPVTPTMTSVSMTASSSNVAMKVGVAEQVRVSVQATLRAAPTAAIGVQFGKSTISKIDGKPWRMEQLPTSGDRGGRFNWNLSNLHGQSFDRCNPMLQESKKSIWQFGKRTPINPLLVLPFGSNGGVNFTGSEFDDTLSWRFSKELENTDALFNVEGVVHTTYITEDSFWETRMVPFELQVEQKLEPCGDASGGANKKKKKKKK